MSVRPKRKVQNERAPKQSYKGVSQDFPTRASHTSECHTRVPGLLLRGFVNHIPRSNRFEKLRLHDGSTCVSCLALCFQLRAGVGGFLCSVLSCFLTAFRNNCFCSFLVFLGPWATLGVTSMRASTGKICDSGCKTISFVSFLLNRVTLLVLGRRAETCAM